MKGEGLDREKLLLKPIQQLSVITCTAFSNVDCDLVMIITFQNTVSYVVYQIMFMIMRLQNC